MTCTQIQEQILQHNEVARVVQEHLDVCTICSEFLSIHSILMEEIPESKPGAVLDQMIFDHAKTYASVAKNKLPLFTPLQLHTCLGAAATIIIVIGLYVVQPFFSREEPPAPEITHGEIITTDEEIYSLLAWDEIDQESEWLGDMNDFSLMHLDENSIEETLMSLEAGLYLLEISEW